MKSLPATEVKNGFGRVLREIARAGGPIYIERMGKPVAVILSVREYERSRRATLPIKKVDILRASFGMWAGRADIGLDWVSESRARWKNEWNNEAE